MVSLGTRVFTDFGSKVIKVKRITDSDDCWEQSVCHHQDVKITPLDAVSVLGAGRSSPRDRLISIANNKVYHVLHPHQKNTFFWHFTWILNYTVDCPSQHWMRKKKFYFIVTEMSSWQLSKKKKKNATEQARKASKHLTVLGHLDWATSVMLSLKQSQYIQQALKRKWLPSLTHLIYHSGSAKCPKTSWKLTIHQFLDLKHNHLALND